MSRFGCGLLIVLVTMGGPACRTPRGDDRPVIVRPGAPGQATRVISAEKATDLSHVQYSAADVRFMQGMIGHHAQALEMAALVPERTHRDDMRLLAKRIDLSQADEIRMMQHWLEARGQQVPGPHAHHAAGATGEWSCRRCRRCNDAWNAQHRGNGAPRRRQR